MAKSTTSEPTEPTAPIAPTSEPTEPTDRIAALEAKVDALLQQNELLAKQVKSDRNVREQQQLELSRRQDAADDRIRKAIAELEAGERKFRVGLAREERMFRTVGARDQGEAEAKYKRFNGIRGTSAENPIVVEPLPVVA